MTEPSALELAERIETNPLGWLPVVGDVINVTFTPEEAKVLTTALRSAPASEQAAWRYQRKVGWGGVWRASTEKPVFETPDDWTVEPLYAVPQPVVWPTVDHLRDTISSEWGSHLCYRDEVSHRICDEDKHCRCVDIARAIVATHGSKP